MHPKMHCDSENRNLYYVQDSDRPLFVLAKTYEEALDKWRDVICKENDCGINEVEPPNGISLVAEYDEVLV